MSIRTPLSDAEDAPSESSVQLLADGTLQLSDVTSRDLSAFTCVVRLQNDPSLAVAETFTITLRGEPTAVCLAVAALHCHYSVQNATGRFRADATRR